MALPLLLLAPVLAGGAIGGLQFYGSKKQSDRAQDAADAIREGAEQQAANIRAQAEREEQERLAQERNERHALKRRRDKIRGRYAKSGVLMQGTPENFLVEQARVDEIGIQDRNRVSRYRRDLIDYRARNAIIAGDNRAQALENRADSMMKKAKVSFATTVGMSAIGGVAGAGGLGSLGGLFGGGGSAGGAGGLLGGLFGGSGGGATSAIQAGPSLLNFSNPQNKSILFGAVDGALQGSDFSFPWEG